MHLNYYIFFLSFLCFPCISYGQQHERIIRLGNQRMIFVDKYLIDSLGGTQIVMHKPYDKGNVMNFNEPWEGVFCGYTTIIKDGNFYSAYYRGLPSDNENLQNTCYAESGDGITWVKPFLGLFKINGSFKNNVILSSDPGTHNFTPFLDQNPSATSDQKYKALGGVLSNSGRIIVGTSKEAINASGRTPSEGGLFAYVSPDGIHWKKLREDPVFKKGIFDSQNVSFWSASEGRYVCYFRSLTSKDSKEFRSVSKTTSSDFIHWTDPIQMTFGNTPYEQLYTQQTSPYFRAPQTYLAIGGRFMEGREVLTQQEGKQLKVAQGYINDVSDVYFMTTRGGNSYDRTFMESFIRPGIGLNNWVSRTNYPALNVVQTGPTEMSIYVNQDYAQPTAHLERYSLRLDGFTSIYGPYKGGKVITKPFTFSGKRLEINYATSAAGQIQIEIQDQNGKPIRGFTMKDSKIFIGNEITRIVSWDGNENVGALASKPVRLCIYLKDADLYSFRFK